MSNKQTTKKAAPIRMLVWGDSPACATGFATVTRNIFTRLASTGKYDIDVIGINDRGEWKDPEVFPMRIYPARNPLEYNGDFYGKDKLIAAVLGKHPDLKMGWDIIFLINDPFVVEAPVPLFNKGLMEVISQTQKTYIEKLPAQFHFKTVGYWPVDGTMRGNWIEKSIAMVDAPVAYAEYTKEEVDRADNTLDKRTNVSSRMKTIYHGFNQDEFFPVEDDIKAKFREQFFEGKIKPDTFVVSIVARNQMRKDIPRAMKIFKEFQKRRPNSFLYIHAQESDAWGSLQEYARNWNLRLGDDWGCPKNFNANTGFPVEAVNLVYNMSDAVLSTSLGEGFGLYNFEAMATNTLVLAPNNTVHPELFGYDAKEDISDMNKLYQKVRGIPIACGTTSSEWATYGGADLERVRPLTNVDDAVKKLIWAYDNPDKSKEIADSGHKWVQQFSWDNIALEWDKLFTDVYNQLQDEREQTIKDTSKQAESTPPQQ